MCKINILNFNALMAEYCQFSQKKYFLGSKFSVLEANRVEIGIQKQL
jgi:hypothetical protein